MPQLPPVQPVRVPQALHSAPHSNLYVRHAESELMLLCQDTRVPPDIKRRLHAVLGELRDADSAHAVHGTQPPTTARMTGTTTSSELHELFTRMLTGQSGGDDKMPAHNSVTPSCVNVNISTTFRAYCKALSSTCPAMRASSVLQSPVEAFQAMNAAMFQTLRYVDTIGEIDFDITNVRDYDDSVLSDSERLFLSVACSVFASFTLCTTLDIDAALLVHFLRDVFECYAADNAFHNALHAADALQMLSLFFREASISCLFSDMEMLCCMLAVLALDVAHPGMHSTSLALLQHPLVMVYGDAMPCEQAALLVFMHKLGHDNNKFVGNSDGVREWQTIHTLRHTITELVLSSALCKRRELTCNLQRIAKAQVVQQPQDTMTLLSALLVLASGSFALRPQQLCATMGRHMVEEMRAEHMTLQRQNLPSTLECVHNATDALVVWVYCSVMVLPLAEAVRALVPSDLYDNLQRNVDHTTVSANALAPTSSSRSSAPASWSSDTCAATAIDTLRKVVMHASSLDRKASQYAILHASPPRTVVGLTSPRGNVEGGASNTVCVASMRRQQQQQQQVCAEPATHPLALQTPTHGPTAQHTMHEVESSYCDHAASSMPPSPHAEHYFSFLRLYDKCEQEGQSWQAFCGQLIFLALQLDVQYVASYARAVCDVNSSSQECQAVAELIMQHEEPPCSAESVISRRAHGDARDTTDRTRNGNTDAFLLLLMHMYSKRHTATTSMTSHHDGASSDMLLHSEAAFGDDAHGRPRLHKPDEAEMCRTHSPRHSPTRLPIDTDTSQLLGSMHYSFVSLDSNSHASA